MSDSLTVNIELHCSKHERNLLVVRGEPKQDSYGDHVIYVEPCEECITDARESGREDAENEREE